MPSGRPKTFELSLRPEERTHLEALTASRSLAAGLVRRARVVLSQPMG